MARPPRATRCRRRSSCAPRSCSGRKTISFNRFGALARALPALPLFGGGATRLQPVFAGDVALAALAAIDDASAAGRAYEARRPGSADAAGDRRAEPAHRRAPPRARPAAVRAGETDRVVDRSRLDAVVRQVPAQGAGDDARRGRAARATTTSSRRRRSPKGAPCGGLGISPQGLEAIAPSYLYRFRKTGQYAARRLA